MAKNNNKNKLVKDLEKVVETIPQQLREMGLHVGGNAQHGVNVASSI